MAKYGGSEFIVDAPEGSKVWMVFISFEVIVVMAQ
jgi:hypothetical protein